MENWHQAALTLPPFARGCHLITQHVVDAMPQIQSCRVGLLHVFIRHTSASLSINENADPDVPLDLTMALNRIAPETLPYRHTCEGADDMPAHIKAALTDSSVSIPVSNGRLMCGIWQGIYLCEHRDRGGRRGLVITLNGLFESGNAR